MKKTTSGFTIIELLVVIVVIAILAAISIVSYNGIQKRAGTIAYTAAVDGLEKHFRMADIAGELPKDPSTPEELGEAIGGVLGFTILGALGMPVAVGHCVGDIADYPETADFDEGECYRVTSSNESESSSVTIDEDLSNTLAHAGMELPRNLPVVKRTYSLQGQSAKIVSRGIYVIMVENVAYILWNPPDASSCGRGLNIGYEIERALQDAGGVDAMIAAIKGPRADSTTSRRLW